MLPRPSTVRVTEGTFRLDPRTSLSAPPELAAVAGWLRGALGPATGCWLPEDAGTPGIALRLDPALGAEAYQLDVTPAAVRITGGDPAGVFYGAQTLRQLLPPAVFRAGRTHDGAWPMPAVHIGDAPRFGWRGCLLDVARRFLPKADVLRFIDLLALHKLNVLHLHLTDDQGWRIEVPGWPRLVTVGAGRRQSMLGARRHERYDGRPHGGYYTGDDLREIVAYAADRFVRVVPEIDLPGHVGAALAAYPELGNTPGPAEVSPDWGISTRALAPTEAALAFCRDVLDEVCAIFPGEYVCIGGDECAADWQSWFTTRLSEHVVARGRRVLGWDELLAAGAPPGTTIAAWRGPEHTAAAARAGFDVVASPNDWLYLDYRQSTHPDEPTPVGRLLTLSTVYAGDPVPPGLTEAEAARVIGVQAAVWTEYLDSARAIDYQAFPRLCAAAEVAWSGPGGDLADFAGRLRVHRLRLDAYGVEYRRDAGPRPWQTRPDAPGWPRD